MLEIAFQTPRNSKFPGSMPPGPPLKVPRAFGVRLHALPRTPREGVLHPDGILNTSSMSDQVSPLFDCGL